ncbi:PepSY domain-containing protein [Tropicimonas sp. IMCC34043]|uniref:PepSY-associated TM helix domain-containing protein n=1 Tax=Tropicimonas sp. IMCC34043 TaxID=2248760 RepID=UPI000E2709FF|nr:PepSY-associated TM helix domain-containing protein [Tropicimonas sp. IMCC34043]
MRIRRVVFWSHLVTGVAAGLVILVMSVTGALLAFETQITRWADPKVTPAAAMLPAEALGAIALAESGGKASTLTLSADATRPAAAGWGRGEQILLDPYTGAALGAGPEGVHAFFGAVTQIHRWLVPLFDRQTGGAITGAANLLFLFLLVSGVVLWWPRAWKARLLRNQILFRHGLPNAKARDYNWHHVLASWAAIPLVLIVLSGVVISYPWASRLVFAAYGETASAGGGRPGGAPGGGAPAVIAPGVGLQAALDNAASQVPDWNRLTLTLPKAGDDKITVMADTGTGHQPARQTTLTFAATDGTLLGQKGIADQTPATRARIWLRFVHTGEVYGVVGQAIAALASLAAAVLVWTGLALAWRRLIRPLYVRRPTMASGR